MKQATPGSAFSLPVIALAMLSFSLGCSEYMVVGILPTIAKDLQVDLVSVGALVSLFAGTYAVCTPILSFATARVQRFRLLMVFVGVFVAGNVLAVIAPSYMVFAVARVVTACVSGASLATGQAFIPDLVDVKYRARAVSLVNAGFSCATVAGVPVGTIITGLMGWHAAFIAITAMAVLVMAVLAHELPHGGESEPESAASAADTPLLAQLSVVKDPRMFLNIFEILTMAGGIYVYYTYITPTLTDAMRVPAEFVSVVLAGNGLLALVSNIFAAIIAERAGQKALPVVFALLVLMLVSLPAVIALGIPAIGAVFFWVLAFVQCLPGATQQLLLMSVAERDYPHALNFALSFNPTSFNIGIALGSAAGGMVMTATGSDYAALGPSAAVLMGCAFACAVLLLFALRRVRAVK